MTVPLSELFFSAEERALLPSRFHLSTGSRATDSCSSPTPDVSAAVRAELPLRVLSEKVRGIAFQLWPAARAFASFMRDMQHDQTAARPLPPVRYPQRATKKTSNEETEAPVADADADVAAAASAVAALTFAPAASAAPTPVEPVVPSVSGWWSGKRVLELGSGCGLNGLLAAALGAQVVLTDVAEVVPHLQANIDANFGPAAASSNAEDATDWAAAHRLMYARTKANALDWCAPVAQEYASGAFDVILLSDCVYWEDLFAPLVRTLRSLVSTTSQTRIFLCQSPRRPKIEKRFFRAVDKSFNTALLRQVAADQDSGERRDIKIYEFTLKK